MLQVQKYLANHTFDNLSQDYHIKLTYHPTDPLVILNYDQLESPKGDKLVRECRGLVLNSETKELVAARVFTLF